MRAVREHAPTVLTSAPTATDRPKTKTDQPSGWAGPAKCAGSGGGVGGSKSVAPRPVSIACARANCNVETVKRAELRWPRIRQSTSLRGSPGRVDRLQAHKPGGVDVGETEFVRLFSRTEFRFGIARTGEQQSSVILANVVSDFDILTDIDASVRSQRFG